VRLGEYSTPEVFLRVLLFGLNRIFPVLSTYLKEVLNLRP